MLSDAGEGGPVDWAPAILAGLREILPETSTALTHQTVSLVFEPAPFRAATATAEHASVPVPALSNRSLHVFTQTLYRFLRL